ncbi:MULTISPECIES: pyroglutamyl-peptidase I [Rhodomicrobium]|uniref:pyroglutamyl-peptidase I n=1 Tax=Rhodomicrobium TaxID=1068 RepID=UPI001482F335|nr:MULTISPECIES: pyroglutamyl-peptidase I [Rhodomicrobium]
MVRPQIRILVTGFGPFPGVPFNASAALIGHLAETDRLRGAGVSLHTAVLPTDWRRASAEAGALIRSIRPDAIVHFGVARRAKGFQVETRAFNATRPVLDHDGRMPGGRSVRPGAPPMLAVTVPSERLVRSLRLARLPAVLSRDAGRYLCNAILYQSLLQARAAADPPLAGFVHIPALPPISAGPGGENAPCGWTELKAGAETIIRALIPYARAARRGGATARGVDRACRRALRR